ncbi:hypothetical protein ME7_01196, partial [Bartonella birtlesii LL-WM9]
MKKLHVTQKANNLKVSRYSFVRVFSLATAATFLSNVSPVYAKSFDIIEKVLQSIEKATATYSQGKDKTIVSTYDNHINSNDSRLSKANNLMALNTASAQKVNISAADSANLMEKTLLDAEEKYKKSLINPRSFVDNNEDTVIIDVSDFSRNNLITRMSRNAGLQRNTDGTSVVVGNGRIPNTGGQTDNVAIGYEVKIKAVDSVAVGYGSEVDKKFSVAVGHLAHSVGQGSIAIGGEGRQDANPLPPGARTIANGEESIAIGRRAKTNSEASIALGSNAQATGDFAITMGSQAQTTREDSIAIGHMAHALGKSSIALGSEYNKTGEKDYTTAKGDYSTALGAVSKALGYGSLAVGHRAYAVDKDAISMGFYSKANAEGSIVVGARAEAVQKNSSAFGTDAKATAVGSIALGASSVADVSSQAFGFDPLLKKATTATSSAWKSGQGAVSVGTLDKTRQIINVAAGSKDTDAVNVAQLKSLQTYVDKGWKLSVNGKNDKAIGIDGTVDLAAGSANLTLTKGEKDNNIKFDLARSITVDKIQTGDNTLDATGLVIANGPKITTSGIDAGGKKIRAIANGDISATSTDAVNGSQLYQSTRGLKVYSHGMDFIDPRIKGTNSIAIGSNAASENQNAIAIGTDAKASVQNGIALGSNSIADVEAGVAGYDPITKENVNRQDPAWHSTLGALSIGRSQKIGNIEYGQTRQIVGVAAGTKDTDAVNVAQLKALQDAIYPNWELSVDGKNKTNVNADNPMDLAAGSANLTLTKGEKDNKVKFDLARSVTVDKIQTGNNILDATGLVIGNGPKITTSGIDAGGKKI